MFVHLHRPSSLNALFTLPLRYVCWCWPQMNACTERFWLFCAVKSMLGLDDSEKNNLLEKNHHHPLPWHFESACIPTVSAHLDAVKYRYMIKKAFQMDGWLMRSMMITSIYYSTGHSVWEMTGGKWPLLYKNFNREGATTSDLHCCWQDLHREFKPQACGARLCDEPLLLKSGFFGILQFLVNFAMLEKMNHYLILTLYQLALWKQWCICHPSVLG